jgi:hypothetical protein
MTTLTAKTTGTALTHFPVQGTLSCNFDFVFNTLHAFDVLHRSQRELIQVEVREVTFNRQHTVAKAAT